MSKPPTKLIRRFASLIGFRRKPTARLQTAPSIDATDNATDSGASAGDSATQQLEENEVFDERLKELALQRGPDDHLVTGRVQMINVDKVRERLGDRWTRFEERVHEIIKVELKNRLSPRDLFRRLGDGSYVIVFGDCPESEAQLKVALLSQQIMEKLLGEAGTDDLQELGLQRIVAEVDGSAAAEALQSTDTLVAALDKVQREGDGPITFDFQDAVAGRRAPWSGEFVNLMRKVDREVAYVERAAEAAVLPAVDLDRLQSLLRQLASLEDALRVQIAALSAQDSRTAASSYLTDRENAKSILTHLQNVRERTERQIVVLGAAEPLVTSSRHTEPLNVEFAYQPMWHASSDRVGIYVCSASLWDEDGRHHEFANEGQDQDAQVHANVDRLAIRKVQDDFGRAAAKGISNIIMVPVHFSTLQRQRCRYDFLKSCSHLTQQQRKLLTWEIVDAHTESWSLQLKSIIRSIAPYGRAIFLRIGDLQSDILRIRHNLPHLRPSGVHAVGIDVTTLWGSETEKLRLLEDIAQRAGDYGLKCYGHGFQSLSMTTCAVCMGYQNVSGPVIAEPTQFPEGVRTIKLEQISRRVLFGDAALA